MKRDGWPSSAPLRPTAPIPCSVACDRRERLGRSDRNGGEGRMIQDPSIQRGAGGRRPQSTPFRPPHCSRMAAVKKRRGKCRPHQWDVPKIGDDHLTCPRCGRVFSFEAEWADNVYKMTGILAGRVHFGDSDLFYAVYADWAARYEPAGWNELMEEFRYYAVHYAGGAAWNGKHGPTLQDLVNVAGGRRKLLSLIHPDRHGGSELANRVTKFILKNT